MTKVDRIILYVNKCYLASLTAENNPNLDSKKLEFTIDKIDSFGNFDLLESCPNEQHRIGLLQASVKLKIEIEIDAKNREFSIKGRAIGLEFLGDFADYSSSTDKYKLRQAILDHINNPFSSFYYLIDGDVEFVEDDWMKEGIKDAI